jgi:2-oxoglutarate ferredoxin oxidoreductase subunit alpha
VKDRLTVGIVGAGGDGVVVLGSFLQRLAAGQGYFSQMPRYYAAQIRGGGTAVKLELDAEHLPLPADSLDIMVCFDWEKYLEFKQELTLEADTLVLCDKVAEEEIAIPSQPFPISFSRISREVTGSAQNKNIVALGLLIAVLALPEGNLAKLIAEDKDLLLLRKNLAAFDAGRSLLSQFSFPELRLSPVRDFSPKVIVHGNAVIAQAAINAGCRAFFGYPITPAAEIMEEMQQKLSQPGDIFLQAEDEISAVGMAVGASLVGAKSMTATSGPGFDLMTEMIGLASSAEIPLVIVDVQRCGPATGIPSKTEQSDLSHAIYGGHGDAPRVVLAPYDVEGCYRLTRESFNIAEYFQTAVILLSDQWLGQTLVAINGEPLKKEYPIIERKRPASGSRDYHRYQITKDSISPMAIAGDEGLTYRTTGLTHDDEGAPAFDFETHHRLHEKRWQKLLPLCQRDDLVRVFANEEARRGIITWGSSAQIVLETVNVLGLQDEVKVCVPELIYPLPNKLEKFLDLANRLMVIEMNYSGQLYHYLRSQKDLPKDTMVYARAGGRPFSRQELTGPILEFVK